MSCWDQDAVRKYCRPRGWLSQASVVGTGWFVHSAHRSSVRLTSLLCNSTPHSTSTLLNAANSCYSHTPMGKVWIYHLLFVCFCNFVRLYSYVSLLRIKLASSILHGGSSASWAGNHPCWGSLLPQKSKIGRIGQPPGSKDHHKRHARDVPFVEYGAACGHVWI